MGNVELPHWLKQLPLAPEFRPTDTEFADPIAYISKIEREVGAFGICKVIPPLPKPSKRYVFNNLNKTLLRTRELGLDVNLGETRDLSKRVIQDKRNVNESRAVFTTRQQELGKEVKRSRGEVDAAQPGAQKQVWQSGELYTLKQFESKSKAFSRSVLGMVKEVTPLVVEAMFWKAASAKPMYVEYANDVPGSGFGEPEGFSFPVCKKRRMCSQRLGGRSYGRQQGATKLCAGLEGKLLEPSLSSLSELGKECTDQPTSSLDESSQSTRQNVLCTNAELEGTAGWKLSNCPWNLQVIARSAGSLTRFMLNDIPGVTSPMVYIGMLFSWFAWHVEDHELHSLNFLHTGSPKTWYAIPGEYAFAFEDVIRKQAYGGDMDHLAALKILGEKTTLLSPEVVVASGIPCCRLVQNPGEYVVTFPRAYHIGFSHGFNVGEAANFGTPQWLTIAKEAAVRRAAMDHLPMLSHQQLLYLLTMSFILRVPRIMLPGVRSSRLRNRLKEERELLVKKAFIEDVLKENHLLNILIGKGTAFRAVLWHPDSLPSLARVSQAGTILDDLLVKDAELSVTPSKDVNEYMHHLNSDKNTMNDLYLDSTDILCDFQVDSGTLVCVTCGILGYPMMSVVQPSKRASMKYFSAGKMSQYGVVDTSQQPDLRHAQCSTKISFPETTNDETWDTSAFFKPRIFCLEHAVQIEELLRPKGGAKILVICHSDYQKIKANAAAVAEELRTTFNYKEVCFDSATQEELKLIEMTIDDEQLADFQEDWTSELGINLRFSVKTRKGCLPKKMEHVLNVDYLLSIMAPVSRIANIKWCCRKSRTKRLPNYRTLATYCDGNFSKKDEVSHVSNSMKVRGKVLLQYYRRKYRTKSRISSGDKYASECSMTFSTEVTNADCTKSNDHNEQDTLGECFKIAETVSEEDSLDKLFVVYGESCDRSSEVVITDAFTLTSSASNLLRTAGVVEDPNNANEDLNVEICSGSPASTLPHVGNPSAGKDMVVVNGCTSRASNPTLMCRPEELNDEQAGGSSTSDHTFLSAYNSEVSSSSLPENSNKHEVYGNAGFNKMENLGDTETCKHDTTSVELDMCNLPKESFNDGCQRGAHASSLLSKNKRLANAKRPSRDKSKGSKKLQTEAQNSYIRSPCEGLRPRKNKVNSVHTLVGNIYEMAEEKPPTKKLRKSSGSSASCNQGLDSKTSYKCNVEGCQLFFRTKVQLSLHNDNKCHHKKCGKKFRSHKYVVLHQRVHDDERPLKCTWAGCTMTFKWAWARTEHLRLHTGERPYQCKIKGCGLTFRFVSDFSRHRRKFGHYVAPTK